MSIGFSIEGTESWEMFPWCEKVLEEGLVEAFGCCRTLLVM